VRQWHGPQQRWRRSGVEAHTEEEQVRGVDPTAVGEAVMEAIEERVGARVSGK
jgi:hypothetical protein